MWIACVSIYGQVSRTFVLITHTNYLHYLLFSSCLDKLLSISSYSIYLYLHRLSPQPVLFTSFLCLVISATNGSLHSHHLFLHTSSASSPVPAGWAWALARWGPCGCTWYKSSSESSSELDISSSPGKSSSAAEKSTLPGSAAAAGWGTVVGSVTTGMGMAPLPAPLPVHIWCLDGIDVSKSVRE